MLAPGRCAFQNEGLEKRDQRTVMRLKSTHRSILGLCFLQFTECILLLNYIIDIALEVRINKWLAVKTGRMIRCAKFTEVIYYHSLLNFAITVTCL